jgi:hypothetical protein
MKPKNLRTTIIYYAASTGLSQTPENGDRYVWRSSGMKTGREKPKTFGKKLPSVPSFPP